MKYFKFIHVHISTIPDHQPPLGVNHIIMIAHASVAACV